MMGLDRKTLLVVGLSILCAVLIWYGISSTLNARRQAQLAELNKQELMQANEKLGKAKTEFGNVEAELKKANQETKDWINRYNGKVAEVGFFSGKLEAYVQYGKGQKIVYVPDKTTIIREGATQPVVVNGDNGGGEMIDTLGDAIWIDTNNDGKPDKKLQGKIALSYKDYRLDISVDVLKNLFDYKLHQNFKGEWVKAILPNGAVTHFLRIYELDDKGNKSNPMQITDFKVTVEDQSGGKKHFYIWDPQIDFGFNASTSGVLNSVTGTEIGVSVMGYGKTKDDNDWRFARVSVASTKKGVVINAAPVCWNAGKKIPMVKDLLLCPTVGLLNSNTIFGISIANPF